VPASRKVTFGVVDAIADAIEAAVMFVLGQ